MEELANSPPIHVEIITKLIYDDDGKIVDITDEDVRRPGLRWIAVDRKEFETKYVSALNPTLRIIDGKIVQLIPDEQANTTHLVPGDTWHADDDNRLITGEPGANTSGWSRKTD